jgi:pimeloyl-ACP methyl ester carboxylesterase
MKTLLTFAIFTLSFLYTMSAMAQSGCDIEQIIPFPKGEQGSDFPTPTLGQPAYNGFNGDNDHEGFRMVYFLHGLNGRYSSWTNAAAAVEEGAPGFPARKAFTIKPDYYETQQNFAGAANTVRSALTINNLLPPSYHPTQGIMIGHSQGGLVGRYLDRYYSQQGNFGQRTFGGLVTVASSNQGAFIVNAEKDHRMLSNTINRLSRELAAGPLSQFEHSENIFVRLIANWVNVGELAVKLIDFGSNSMGQMLVAQNLPRITDDYKVGAPMITETLNTYVPRVRRNGQFHHTNLVAFYSVRDTLTYHFAPVQYEVTVKLDENGDPVKEMRTHNNMPLPISWATLNFFTHDVNDSAPFSAQNEEYELSARVHSTRTYYTAHVEYNRLKENQYRAKRNKAIFVPGLAFGLPLAKYFDEQRKAAETRKNEWQRGVDFIDNADRSYRVIIGALTSEEKTQNITQCHCLAVNDVTGETLDLGSRFISASEGDCEGYYAAQFPLDGPFTINCTTQFYSMTTFDWRHKDSDGVVLAESAMNIPQATYVDARILQKKGSTHMSIRNDGNTQDILTNIFMGDVGEFFETEEK